MSSLSFVYALKARELPDDDRNDRDLLSKAPRLLLSGSRGFGGVCVVASNEQINVNVFDLEEDETLDEGSEEGSYE